MSITDFRQITVDWAASNPGDYVRILTTFSPLLEPSTGALLGISLLGLARRGRGTATDPGRD